MREPALLVISGPPCAGKTTLGIRVAADLSLPFIHKVGIKERLFETLAWHDREWSRRLGIASIELLYYFAECELRAGQPCIVESNFDPELATRRFLALKRAHDFRPVQVQCVVDRDVLLRRLQARADFGDRHPGHFAHLYRAPPLTGKLEALEIGGELIEVDTTDLGESGYGRVLHTTRAAMEGSPPISCG